MAAEETFSIEASPWWTFYTKPSSTFERILRDYPETYSIMMALGVGFATLLQHLFNRGLAAKDIPGAIYLEAFIIGPFFGLACYYLSGWLFTVISERLGGQGTPLRNRTVWAWCFVPYLTGMFLLWIPLTLAAVARSQFIYKMPEWLDHTLLNAEILFYYAFVPFWCWSLYLLLVGLMEANRISLRTAILTTLFSYLVIGAVTWGVYMSLHVIASLVT